ncbi:MAG: hypothetical protein WA123_07145, partial [Methylotenera sp.]
MKAVECDSLITRSELDIMMKSKFELPESIFNVTKGLSNKPKQPWPITRNPSVKTKPLQEHLDFLIRSPADTESNSPKSLKMAGWVIII